MPTPYTADELARFQAQWQLEAGVAYLNHGSFGPSPLRVQAARSYWQTQLEREPMDFFVRRLGALLRAAREALGRYVGAAADDLVLIDNATVGMNIVAASFPLAPGDEVLLNDHEYGAVLRIWGRACESAGAKLRVCTLPYPIESPDQVIDALLAAATQRTRLIVVSHVTSPTALIFPVEALIRAAHARGIAVAVDGPHAVGMLPLKLANLGADYYTASCHKWLSAPFGSGFLYVAPSRQGTLASPVCSWGRAHQGCEPSWRDEFEWLGTRDPSALLAIADAIAFPAQVEAGSDELPETPALLAAQSPPSPEVQAAIHLAWDRYRAHARDPIREISQSLYDLLKQPPLTAEPNGWLGSMAAVTLPPGDAASLQQAYWERYRIEVPVVAWGERRLLRVSWHLYNRPEHLTRLIEATRELLGCPG